MNVAVCPAVTIWLAGWLVIEGAVEDPAAEDPFVAGATYPPHPAFTIPIARSNTNKTTPRRFMITSLFQNVFPGRQLLSEGEEQLTGENFTEPATLARLYRGWISANGLIKSPMPNRLLVRGAIIVLPLLALQWSI